MNGDKENFHDEICEMAAEREAEAFNDFYGGPDDSIEAFQHFIDHEIRIVDSYPHDYRRQVASTNVQIYRQGFMTRTGAACP